jgi:hypothetical protein
MFAPTGITWSPISAKRVTFTWSLNASCTRVPSYFPSAWVLDGAERDSKDRHDLIIALDRTIPEPFQRAPVLDGVGNFGIRSTGIPGTGRPRCRCGLLAVQRLGREHRRPRKVLLERNGREGNGRTLQIAPVGAALGWSSCALASHGTLDIYSVAQAVLGTLAFLAVSFTIGRRVVFRLIRWANDSLASSSPVISVILLLMGGMALIAHLIGVHTVLGAFVAGVLVGESPILTGQIDERLRGLITSLFMPVFFGLAGLTADLTVLRDPQPAVAHRCAGFDRKCGEVRRRLCRWQPRRIEPLRMLCVGEWHELL